MEEANVISPDAVLGAVEDPGLSSPNTEPPDCRDTIAFEKSMEDRSVPPHEDCAVTHDISDTRHNAATTEPVLPVAPVFAPSTFEHPPDELPNVTPTSLPNIALQEQEEQIRTDELSSSPIKVIFKASRTVFYVQKDIWALVLGPQARPRVSLDSGQILLDDVSPHAVSLLVRLFYSPQPQSRDLDLESKNLQQLIDLYFAATRFGPHEWVRAACLEAIATKQSSMREILAVFGNAYQHGHIDPSARSAFKRLLHLQLSSPDTNIELNVHDIVVNASQQGGDFAGDIVAVLLKDRHHNETEQQKSSQFIDANILYSRPPTFPNDRIPVRQPHNPPPMPTWSDDMIHARSNNTTNDASWNFSRRARPRSGWVETAPPSEAKTFDDDNHDANTVSWAEILDRNCLGWENNAACNVEESVSEGGTGLWPAGKWGHPRDCDDRSPTRTESTRAGSASDTAANGWNVSGVGVGNGWNWRAINTPEAQARQYRRASTDPATAVESGLRQYLEEAPPSRLQGPPSITSLTPANPSRRRLLLAHQSSDQSRLNALGGPNATATARVNERLKYHGQPMEPPTVCFRPNDDPIGMPHYVPFIGYNQYVSLGAGMIHSTCPGIYGLAGRTMAAARDSGPDCTLYFKAGDIITNVIAIYPSGPVPMQSASAVPGLITHMQGICRGRAGQFPPSYIREVEAPTLSTFATPFDPPGSQAQRSHKVTKMTRDASVTPNFAVQRRPKHNQNARCGNWGCGQDNCDDCRGDEIVVSTSRPPHGRPATSDEDHVRWDTTSWDDIDDGQKNDAGRKDKGTTNESGLTW